MSRGWNERAVRLFKTDETGEPSNDVVAIWEFPNNKAAMKAAVKSASLGHIQISTMPALPRNEWTDLLGEVFGKKKK